MARRRSAAAWSWGLALVALAAVAAGAEEASPPERAATEREAEAVPVPSPRTTADAIEQAWAQPAASLEERVWRTRRAALERGVWNLDAVARALLVSKGPPLDRAEAAVRLAPDLPAGHMELASALWLHGDAPLSALRTAVGALLAFGRHPEGALWLGGSLLAVLAHGLLIGGLLCIAVLAVPAVQHAAHDFGDLFLRSMPAFGRAALLGSVLLLPVALGEGLLGLAIGVAGVAAIYAGTGRRVVLLLAALAVVLGAHPVARLAGSILEALPNDPVARAAVSASRGLTLPADLARLEAAADRDLLAQQALAQQARRAGHMGRADAMYQSLVNKRPEDPVILTNAANVRLHLGHMEAAFELYRRAAAVEPSSVVLYNLAQAHGRAFQVDDLTRTLERAQALDGDLVSDLTRLQGTQPEGFVVDLPLSNRELWKRVLARGSGDAWSAEFRAGLAPGRAGATAWGLAGAFGASITLGWLLGLRVRASRWCERCGRRVCPRCDPERGGGELCRSCHRLFHQPEQTHRELRASRIDALRTREARLDKIAWAASIAIPGAAGLLAERPLRALVGAVAFSVALAAALARDGIVPDPLVAGAAAPFAFLSVATLAGVVYALVVGSSLAARRRC